MRTRMMVVFFIFITLIFWSWAPQKARAASIFIVSNLNDSGAGSLRNAMEVAGTGDTITFQSGLSGTITLTAELNITDDLNIVGPGPDKIALDGNNGGGNVDDTHPGYPIFYIFGYDFNTVNISGLTLQNATVYVKGAAIYNDSVTLNIDNCVFTGNKTYTGDGGGAGIYNHTGTVTVNHSLFLNNYSEWGIGAGIYTDADLDLTSSLTVNNSAFITNTIGGSGGGIGTYGNSTVNVANSTFYGNMAEWGGAIGTAWSHASLTVTDSTFNGNSSKIGSGGTGAIYIDTGDGTTITLGNTIIAGNTSQYGLPDINGPVNSLGYNLIGSSSGSSGWAASDQLNTDPLLNPPAANGGPTPTMSLQPSSPAIGMGNCSVGTPVTTDQRGVARKTPACDVGAYESAYNPEVYNTNDHGGGSLRYVVTFAPSSGTIISFEPTYFNGHKRTITLTSGGLTIANNLTIAGPGADMLSVDGNNAATVFTINSGTTVAISGLNIQHGSGGSHGGGIDNTGTLSLSNCAFTANSANTGGGLEAHGTAVTISSCTFSGNSATSGYGGGLYSSGPLTISNSTFSGNSAHTGGGGLYVNAAGTLTVGNSTVSANSTLGYGGGIYNYNGTLDLGSSIVAGNTAGIIGPDIDGAVTSLGSNLVGSNQGVTGLASNDQQNVDPLLGSLNYNGGLTMTMPLQAESPAIGMGNCNLPAPSAPVTADQRTFTRKTPACDAGAYETSYDPVVHTDADSGGGSLRYTVTDAPSGITITFDPAVFNTSQTITLTSGPLTVAQNMTIQGSGADLVAVDGNSTSRIFTINTGVTASISGLTIQNGNASYGAGLFNNGTLTLSNTAFTGNSGSYGGAIYASAGTLTLQNSTLSGNTASANGGALSNHTGSTVLIQNSTITGNTSDYGGGFYNSTSATLTISNSTVSGNGSSYPLLGSGGGGGIYTRGVLHLGNSIVAGNTLFHLGIHPSDIDGAVASAGNNLIGNTTSVTGLVSSDLQNVDPLLGALGNNGGPTQTMAPALGSPAIDAANDTNCLSTDQRGASRPQGLHCDIGAVEVLTISGNTGVAGATLSYTDGAPLTATADGSGNYSFAVSYDWSGTVTPSKIGYIFSPVDIPYSNVVADQTGQDYTATAVATFADVPTSYWAWNWIERLYHAGITGGCGTSPLIYCPGNSVTRAQMAIFLERGMRGSSYTPPAGTGTVFGDVPISYWADSWIEKLYADGITGGCGGGNYCPGNPVTRAQMAIFLLRAEHGSSYTPPAATGTVFGDVPISFWDAAWIEKLYAEGITGGCGGGNYCPGTAVTRAQIAVFLVRTFNLP